jgi:hypothetical protein
MRHGASICWQRMAECPVADPNEDQIRPRYAWSLVWRKLAKILCEFDEFLVSRVCINLRKQ